MNETQKRIKAYKEALPGLRERVVAVALLLAMSAAMMTSASFAWLTISRRPEVTGVNTTVAANGNLEIALVSPDGNKPDESNVGDSSATKGQSIAASNITWGNLVNLSDPAYGLDNLILRPAQLNTTSLLKSPLYGAVYGQDGRITQLSSSFGYAIWNPPEGDKPGYFGVSDGYGVRAISSTTVQAVGAEAIYFNMVNAAKDKNLLAANTYKALGTNSNYMPSLATMMGLYMTARMNPDNASLSNPDVDIKDIQNLRDMYEAFLVCFDLEADAMAALVNLQLFLTYGDGNYTAFTAADIYNSTDASLKQQDLFIEKLNQFKTDRATIASDYEKLVAICSSGQNLTWKDTGLNNIVNNLVNVGACTIGANNTPISSIGASNAASYLSGTQEARITNGILYRFEERTGGYIEVKGLSISAKVNRLGMTIPASVKANIQTSVPRDYTLFNNDLEKTETMNDGDYAGGIPVAEDTYGLAIDLWVRTNAAGSYLTLEGNVLTESEWVRATTTDTHGNKVDVFTVEISAEGEDGESISYTIDVYKGKITVQNQNGTSTEEEAWFNADNHAVVSAEELGNAEPAPKMVEVVNVIGFEGENRVWGDNDMISVDATTQGSGSCYVYYADTPEDQARSLRLLEAFNVAFVDEEGKLLATAVMDTARYYATSGRVIVPLVPDSSNSVNLGEDSQGNVTYAITALEQNVPTRITAIVYLDGTKLTNQEVLAAADIQGQLNIQFGSTQDLNPVVDTTLQDATRKVTASVSVSEFDYDTATGPMTTRVTVHVDGEQPTGMTAFFMRSINATQGSRESTMTFTQGENGDWYADYTFTAPGTYVLRNVRLDGVDYDLPDNPPTNPLPKVVVSGFAIDYLDCAQANEYNHVNIMSAANSTTLDLSLKFVADDPDKLPTTVVGRYIHDTNGSAVNVDFTFNPTTQIWSGTATFYSSGEYTLQFLVLDGEYVELVAPQYDDQGNVTSIGQWQTVRVTLGMRVRVYTNSPHKFKFVPSEMTDNEKMLAMQVEIVDNTGKLMPGLTDVWLTYGMKDSGVKVMQTALTWNGTYYVGELPAVTGGPGIWQFSNVTVDGSTLTYAEQYPIFTIMSPEPPAYVGHTTVASQFTPDNNATMNARITNSDAASVQAFIQRSNGTDGVWVTGVKKNAFTTEDEKPGFNWEFPVPTKDGYQDGNWVMTQLEIWDVFDAAGNAYTEDEPLVVDVKDNNITKVVARIYVEFATNRSQDFGKANGTVTGKFMDGYTISGLDVVIKDFEGNPIPGIKDVKLSFVYGNNSVSYGGYSGPDNSTADFVIALSDDGSGTHFVQPADKSHTIRFAGSYNTIFSFVISRSGQSDQLISFSGDNLPANAPQYTVSSVTPAITLKSRTTYDGSSTNGSTITVAYGHSTETTCGITYHNYSQANVVFTLSGYGNASGAALIFTESGGGAVRLYVNKEDADNKRTDRYSWTADGDCTRWVGFWNSQTGSDRATAAGTIKATQLTLTFDGKEYYVDIDDITIINPTPPT